mmetsp:Transcript_14212/g.21643  ORF Transcript_14212/g.21643 Transcript_14212/m.21643 type:complete len:101 (+) Transcript_14212:311-613(+)
MPMFVVGIEQIVVCGDEIFSRTISAEVTAFELPQTDAFCRSLDCSSRPTQSYGFLQKSNETPHILRLVVPNKEKRRCNSSRGSRSTDLDHFAPGICVNCL